MKRLSLLDAAFTYAEKRNQPLHVAYLNLYSLPPGAPPDFVSTLAARIRSYQTALPPFNQRLKRRLGAAWWTEDSGFDVDHHLVHLSLPRPGRMQQLLEMVSRVHASHLDRAYPLWRMYLIEGLEDGRIATYAKIHHAMVDGIAGTRLMLKSMSADPDEVLPPHWAQPPYEAPERSDLLNVPIERASRLLSLARNAAASAPALLRELRQSLDDYRSRHPDFVSGFAAPPTIFNQRISASRRYLARSWSLTRIKSLGLRLGCTTNDIVLAMCAAGLRKYLLEHQALPERPLIAMVPMSTRRDHGESGNQIVFLLANLATDLAEPLARLRKIVGSVSYSKERYQQMRPAQILAYNLAMFGPSLVNLMANPGRGWLPFNLVISNVPGPRTQMYWQGCRLDGMYPVSVVTDGMALNISLTGRRFDAIDFGITACRRTLPGVDKLIDYFEDGVAELETCAGLAQRNAGSVVELRAPLVAAPRSAPPARRARRRARPTER